MNNNKVKFGLSNVHYAVVTETVNASTGAITSSYGPVKAWPGAVNLTCDPNGEDSPFRADDMDYFMLSMNNGYTGTYECADVPEDVELNVYGQTKDANGVITEKASDTKKYIALMFEFKGDQKKRRFVFYRVMLSRHPVNGQTTDTTITPSTDSISFTATPRPDDDAVKSCVYQGDAAYSGWYSSVYAGGTVIPSVSIEPKVINLGTTGSFDLDVAVVPAGQTVTFTSSDGDVATVTSAGKIEAVAAGDCVITASITVDGVEYTDTVTVIVA